MAKMFKMYIESVLNQKVHMVNIKENCLPETFHSDFIPDK